MFPSHTLWLPGLLLLCGCATAAETDDAPPPPDAPAFNQLDQNGDGRLSKGETAGAGALESHFPVLDRDGDGALSRPEFSAFEALLKGQGDPPLRWRERPMEFGQLPERWKNAI